MKWIGLVIALFIAAAAAFIFLKFSGNDAPTEVTTNEQINAPEPTNQVPSEVETANVYVAANFIPIGTVLQEHMLDTQPWPQHLLLDGFVSTPEDGRALVGKVTRAPFQAREPFIQTKLVNPGDPNFIAGNLPKGMRVVTIATDGIAGVAGFVFPGDRVDVIIAHEILKEGVSERDIDEVGDTEAFEETVTEILLPNTRVLAVDQRSSAGVNEDGGIIIPQSVTLEVSAENAQRLRLASELGRISLALRSLEDKEEYTVVETTRPADLSLVTYDGPSTETFQMGQLTKTSGTEKTVDKADAPRALKKEEYIPVVVVRGTQIENQEARELLEQARTKRAQEAE